MKNAWLNIYNQLTKSLHFYIQVRDVSNNVSYLYIKKRASTHPFPGSLTLARFIKFAFQRSCLHNDLLHM